MGTQATDRVINQQQWSWWCQDHKAVQDAGLGNANCPVCSQEPEAVAMWRCEPGSCVHFSKCGPDTVQHVKFRPCGHLVDVEFTEEARNRMHP